MDLTKYLGLASEVPNMFVVILPEYDRVCFFLSISKYVCDNPAMLNFGISQVKFDMRLLHWIIVNILYMKHNNWGKVDDNDLYLMLALMTNSKVNWVKIVFKEVNLVEAPKILYYSGVSKMRYYMDIDGDYYYLEESGKKVYDDKVTDPINDPSDEAGGSSSGLLYADSKSCLYELVGKILADN
ncbi:hypothetical protein KIW84_011209 [Lathyrus oleraceus]|uniref:Uncharacterized protein n=1 Tax=Pisum sativum TaxID=3888 RepID=A0A9D4YNS8_PEA|nr:hypothetical protein KIW84_011209 [Pisum sativum]